MNLGEARRRTLEAAVALRAQRPLSKAVRLWDAMGAVLAEDVLADRDQPPFHRVAMDGYAVRSADLNGPEVTLDVVGEVPAGARFPGVVEAGQAVAVMTGAPLPEGADAVQRVEWSRREEEPWGDGGRPERIATPGEVVVLRGPLEPWTNVARQGEDIRRGEPVVEAGRVVEGLTAGVLASVGATRVAIVPRPRVTVVSTGDELVDLDAEPGPSQIRDSNRHQLLAALHGATWRAVDGGRVGDDVTEIAAAVRAGLTSDVLVLSGGVSAGVYDLVAQVLEREGVETLFHRVRLKPGRPLLVGRHPGGLVFGLPGNPVSAYVAAQLFVIPALRVLSGRTVEDAGPRAVTATLDGELAATGSRDEVRSGLFVGGGGGEDPGATELRVRPVPFRGSGDQVNFARGSCLIWCPRDRPAQRGGTVRVLLPF